MRIIMIECIKKSIHVKKCTSIIDKIVIYNLFFVIGVATFFTHILTNVEMRAKINLFLISAGVISTFAQHLGPGRASQQDSLCRSTRSITIIYISFFYYCHLDIYILSFERQPFLFSFIATKNCNSNDYLFCRHLIFNSL